MVDDEKVNQKRKSYFLPLFENILIVDALESYFMNKISFTQNSHKTLKANHGAVIAQNLVEFVELTLVYFCFRGGLYLPRRWVLC